MPDVLNSNRYVGQLHSSPTTVAATYRYLLLTSEGRDASKHNDVIPTYTLSITRVEKYLKTFVIQCTQICVQMLLVPHHISVPNCFRECSPSSVRHSIISDQAISLAHFADNWGQLKIPQPTTTRQGCYSEPCIFFLFLQFPQFPRAGNLQSSTIIAGLITHCFLDSFPSCLISPSLYQCYLHSSPNYLPGFQTLPQDLLEKELKQR